MIYIRNKGLELSNLKTKAPVRGRRLFIATIIVVVVKVFKNKSPRKGTETICRI